MAGSTPQGERSGTISLRNRRPCPGFLPLPFLTPMPGQPCYGRLRPWSRLKINSLRSALTTVLDGQIVPTVRACGSETTNLTTANQHASRFNLSASRGATGRSLPRHRIFGAALDADTFFAKPYHAWERGLNEHTNGLARQYFPKSTDFTTVSDDEVLRVEELLNNRPRAVLGFKTPLEVFSNPRLLQRVALTA